MAASTPLTRVEAALARAARDLDELGRRWALLGGLAVSARSEPRFTRDADLAVMVTDDRDAERLALSLQNRGYCVVSAVEQEATGRLATVRLAPPGETERGVVVDLLFASSGIEPEIVPAAEPLEILPGLRVPVAQLGHLLALKVLARDDRTRPQDRSDINALLSNADATAVTLARDALRLVTDRGFNPGRDLLADLTSLIAQPPLGTRPGQNQFCLSTVLRSGWPAAKRRQLSRRIS